MEAAGVAKREHVRESARQRRLSIIEATLRVMQREGLRAVSHRAVAREADVPLAATTYYFRDLEDLITESFLHWTETQRHVVEAFHARALALIGKARTQKWSAATIAARLADAGADYVVDQVDGHRGDRVLELAFLHEAVHLPRLREVVERQQQRLLGFLAEFHAAIGSAKPAVDAQITNSVLLGVEKQALLSGAEQVDRAAVRAVLLRHLQGALAGGAESGKKALSPRR